MSETIQGYFTLGGETEQTNLGFQSTLAYIREAAQSERRKGDLFERLMLTYFSQDPDYQQQFSEVYLYKDWAALQTGYDANDIGIDLVAKERDGGYCAIQCKCYAEDTRISKPHLDSFIYGILHAPSYREQFANDLSKMIPRIPYAPDFRTFAEAGKALADLHLNYETCQQYPDLNVEPLTPSLLWEEKPEHFRLGTRAMRFTEAGANNPHYQ